MRKIVLAALLATVTATPAFAQSSPDLGGFRIEGVIGYDAPSVEGESADGVLYGVGVGYDIQSGNAVFGIEGEITDSSADECVGDVVIAGDALCVSSGRDLYAGGRVGAAVGRNTLLYAKAGYTNARVRLDYDDGTPTPTAILSGGRNLDGIRVGAGAQFGIGENSYLKAEYRYSNYEDGFDRHQAVAGFGFRF